MRKYSASLFVRVTRKNKFLIVKIRIEVFMLNQFSRTQLLIGEQAIEKLKASRVAVFGIGGVGGYVCEALVRSGVGEFDLIDDDKVCLTNLNRQIIATRKTVGKYKADVMKERMLEINPDVKVHVHKCFFLPENADEFPFEEYDYVVDAVDTVTAKLEIIMRAKELGVPVISAMGAGNKLDPGRFHVTDIYKTKVCPLARVMRRELKKRNVKSLKVVYSDEQPIRPMDDMSISCRTNCICPPGAKHKCTDRRDIPGSTAFVPAVAGLMIAGEIVKDLSNNTGSSSNASGKKGKNGYHDLKCNLVDMVVEEQAKLGYNKEAIRLYYPLSSLNHILNTSLDTEEMLSYLKAFPAYVEKIYGEVKVSKEGDRFCFYLGEDFSEYVHTHKAGNRFLAELVELVGKHGTTLQQIEEFFHAQEKPCVVEPAEHGEFDILIRFTEGNDNNYYCFKDEGCHIIYHRFLPKDYEDFDF